MVAFKHGISKFIKYDQGGMERSFAKTSGILLSGGLETWKLICVLLLLMFSLNGKILPPGRQWLTENGYPYSSDSKFSVANPKLSVLEMVVNCCSAVLELSWFISLKHKSEPQLQTLEYLIANARAHYLILYQLKFRLQHMVEAEDDSSRAGGAVSGKRYRNSESESVMVRMVEPKCQAMKHHFMVHYVEQARNIGGEFRIVDTEPTEHLHIYLVGGNFTRIGKHQEHTTHDMLRRVQKDQMMAFNALINEGSHDPHEAVFEPVLEIGGDVYMDFVVVQNASSQYLQYDKVWKRWSIRRDGTDKYASAPPFVHPRISEEQLCDFLSLEEQLGKLPTENVRFVRLVTQCRVEYNQVSDDLESFYINAKPPNMFKERKNLIGNFNKDEFSFVEVEYTNDAGRVERQVALVVGIINYQVDAVDENEQDVIIEETMFLIAWMQDANILTPAGEGPCPFPYPVKSMIVTPCGLGGATRTGNRFLLDFVHSRSVVSNVFIIKALTNKGDTSLANPANISWELHEKARYFQVTRKRQTPSDDYVCSNYEGKYPECAAGYSSRRTSAFMTTARLEWVYENLSRQLPPNTRKRWESVKKNPEVDDDNDDDAHHHDGGGGDGGGDDDDDDDDDDRARAPRGLTFVSRSRR